MGVRARPQVPAGVPTVRQSSTVCKSVQRRSRTFVAFGHFAAGPATGGVNTY